MARRVRASASARTPAALGNLVVSIEHTGSTAVPGLAAKPIIDLVVVVEHDDVDAAIERLPALGYVHRGDLGVAGREAFDAAEGVHSHHLYVSAVDSEQRERSWRFATGFEPIPSSRPGTRPSSVISR